MIIGLRVHHNKKINTSDPGEEDSTLSLIIDHIQIFNLEGRPEEWEIRETPDGKRLDPNRSLQENLVRSRQDLYLERRSIENLHVEVELPSGKIEHRQALRNHSTDAFITDLVDSSGLGKLDEKGRTIEYLLQDSQKRHTFDRYKTLGENEVFDGQRLSLKGPPGIRITIASAEGRSGDYEVDPGTHVSRLIEERTSDWHLDKFEPNRRIIPYLLRNERTRAVLDPQATLSECGIHDGDSLILLREGPIVITFSVRSEDNRVLPRQLSLDATVDLLIQGAVHELDLPRVGRNKGTISYFLFREETQHELDARKSLADNHVVEGEIISLKSRMDPVGLSLRKILLPLAILILVAAAGFGAYHISHATPRKTISKTLHIQAASYAVSSAGTLNLAVLDEKGVPVPVTWSLSPDGGQIQEDGTYTAPSSIASSRNVVIHASSKQDPSVTASATISLVPPIMLSPAESNLEHDQTIQFSSKIGPGMGTEVTWTLSDQVGELTQTGLYIAPAIIPEPTTITVTAFLEKYPQYRATASIALSVSSSSSLKLQPSSVSLDASQSHRFRIEPNLPDHVTWTVTPAIGAINSAGVYTAPPLVQNPTTLRVIAKVGGIQAAGSIKLQPVAMGQIVAQSLPNGTTQFKVPVSHTENTGVSWSLNPELGSISSEGLYTPPHNHHGTKTLQVTAKSLADQTKMAQTSFDVTEKASVTLSSSEKVLSWIKGKVKFSAIVNSCKGHIGWTSSGPGSINPDGTYVPPKEMPRSDQKVTITVACYDSAGKKEASDDVSFVLKGSEK